MTYETRRNSFGGYQMGKGRMLREGLQVGGISGQDLFELVKDQEAGRLRVIAREVTVQA